MTEVRKEFLFLNRLRETGATNMFGATPYLVKHMKMKEAEARKVLIEWMKWVEEEPSNRDL
jgi:hypothetical protein